MRIIEAKYVDGGLTPAKVDLSPPLGAAGDVAYAGSLPCGAASRYVFGLPSPASDGIRWTVWTFMPGNLAGRRWTPGLGQVQAGYESDWSFGFLNGDGQVENRATWRDEDTPNLLLEAAARLKILPDGDGCGDGDGYGDGAGDGAGDGYGNVAGDGASDGAGDGDGDGAGAGDGGEN